VPARLVRDADALAARLLLAPACAAAPGAGAEHEAGYALLGALCAALPPEQLAARRGAMLALWAPALGPNAAAALDLTKYAAPGAPDQVRPGCAAPSLATASHAHNAGPVATCLAGHAK
jgi:hypothetical protein